MLRSRAPARHLSGSPAGRAVSCASLRLLASCGNPSHWRLPPLPPSAGSWTRKAGLQTAGGRQRQGYLHASSAHGRVSSDSAANDRHVLHHILHVRGTIRQRNRQKHANACSRHGSHEPHSGRTRYREPSDTGNHPVALGSRRARYREPIANHALGTAHSVPGTDRSPMRLARPVSLPGIPEPYDPFPAHRHSRRGHPRASCA